MKRLLSSLLLLTFYGPCVILAAQTPAATQPAPAKPSPTPSAILKPALDNLQQALSVVRLEKWKGTGTIREEAEANISSIHRDLESTLPSLLAEADASPNSVVHLLPTYDNIGALYDVLLRVTAGSKLAAPSQQSAALDQAMTSLDAARRTLSDRLHSEAMAQEKQVSDLKATLRTVQATPAPVVAACPPPPPPAKKRKAAPKTTKPTTSTSSTNTTPASH